MKDWPLFNLRVRKLSIFTQPPFKGNGEDLRLAVTAHWKDDPALHGHGTDGRPLYRLPPVRYLPGPVPRIVGINEGIRKIELLYDSIGEVLVVRKTRYTIEATEFKDFSVQIGCSERLFRYKSISTWIALNQDRYKEYIRTGSTRTRKRILERVFVGNLLSLSKGIGYTVTDTIMVNIEKWEETTVELKGLPLLGFRVILTTNFILFPDVGIGRHTSLGFGRFAEV